MTIIDVANSTDDFEYVKDRLKEFPYVRSDKDVQHVLDELYAVTRLKYHVRYVPDVQFFAVAQRAMNKRK